MVRLPANCTEMHRSTAEQGLRTLSAELHSTGLELLAQKGTQILQAESLRLDDEQRWCFARLRRVFLRNLGILLARRQRISTMLQARKPAQRPRSG